MQLHNPNLFRQQCLVNGEWVEACSGKNFLVTNPYDESVVGAVPDFNETDTQAAIEAAHKAWPAWRDKTPRERAVVLHRVRELILEHIDDLAIILTTEQGKPLAEARTELLVSADYFQWYAEEARRRYGQFIPLTGKGRQPITISQSIGVAALISPWNFPSSMLARKMAAALAAGCALVAKPASATPYSALALGAICQMAGVPAGVCNVVTGNAARVSSAFMASTKVRALSFTGSTETGKQLYAQAAATVKKISLELGGNAPYIVFADADLDLAARSILPCKFRNGGQTCICANKILVEASVHDAFVEKLCAVMRTIKQGNGLAEGTTQGPLINRQAVAAMRALVKDAVDKGASIKLGGASPAEGEQFFEPTVLTEMNRDMRVINEEIFGPLVPVMRFHSEAEALELANDTEFGLASYLFTRDVSRVWRMSSQLESGMVGVNEVVMASGEVPFGGVKQSGIGREGGIYGLDEYMETKYILLGIEE